MLATDDCGVATPDGALFALDDDLAFTVNYGPVLVAVEVALIAERAISGWIRRMRTP